MRARWLLVCALTVLLAGAEGSLLPPAARRLLGHFQHLLGGSRAELGQEEGRFEAPIDFRKLPPNYHTEEKEQRRVGNATLYSHREINKVTDNKTGAMLFSDRMVTSIEQGERGLAERWRPSLAHREVAVAYYSTNSLPWSLQDGHGSVANLPRGTTSVEDNGQTKRLSEELVDGYEGERLPLDTDDPDQSNFQ
ncbi:unnamed protein product [Caretta caretta]